MTTYRIAPLAFAVRLDQLREEMFPDWLAEPLADALLDVLVHVLGS